MKSSIQLWLNLTDNNVSVSVYNVSLMIQLYPQTSCTLQHLLFTCSRKVTQDIFGLCVCIIFWKSARLSSYQVVVWFDAEQISEVSEGQRGIGLEAEVRIVMSRSQVTSLTCLCDEKPSMQEKTKNIHSVLNTNKHKTYQWTLNINEPSLSHRAIIHSRTLCWW